MHVHLIKAHILRDDMSRSPFKVRGKNHIGLLAINFEQGFNTRHVGRGDGKCLTNTHLLFSIWIHFDNLDCMYNYQFFLRKFLGTRVLSFSQLPSIPENRKSTNYNAGIQNHLHKKVYCISLEMSIFDKIK